MATILYKCDVCKRTTEILENIHGITVFSKCIVTDKCNGKLHKIKRNRDSQRESLPDYSSYDNYSPRLAFFSHEQAFPTTTWNIEHNLNCSPAVTVFQSINGSYVELPQDEYTITVIDTNNLILVFKNQINGIAHLLSRNGSVSSVKLLSNGDKLTQVTANTCLTLAFPKYINVEGSIIELTGKIRLQIELIKPNEDIIYCFEDFDPVLTVDSPWYTWPTILLRKRKQYKNRSKLITKFRTIEDENIPNGTRIKFTGIDYTNSGTYIPIESKFVNILLADSPFTQYDKNIKQICDIGEMFQSQYNYFVYTDGDLYTHETNIESTYPDIVKS